MKRKRLAMLLAIVLCLSTVTLAMVDSMASASAAEAVSSSAAASNITASTENFADIKSHWAKGSIDTAVAQGWF